MVDHTLEHFADPPPHLDFRHPLPTHIFHRPPQTTFCIHSSPFRISNGITLIHPFKCKSRWTPSTQLSAYAHWLQTHRKKRWTDGQTDRRKCITSLPRYGTWSIKMTLELWYNIVTMISSCMYEAAQVRVLSDIVLRWQHSYSQPITCISIHDLTGTFSFYSWYSIGCTCQEKHTWGHRLVIQLLLSVLCDHWVRSLIVDWNGVAALL